MGIENLLSESYSQFDAFNEQQRKTDINPKSVARVAGLRIIEHGREMLKETSEYYDQFVNLHEREVLEEQMRIYGAESAAVIAHGASILALEDTLVDKKFDYDAFLGTLNMGIRRTLYPPFNRPEFVPQVSPVDQEVWEGMIELQKGDKYFSLFFMPENERFMPGQLGRFLKNTGFIHTIRENLQSEPPAAA